jgi:hypothetical protein
MGAANTAPATEANTIPTLRNRLKKRGVGWEILSNTWFIVLNGVL